MTRTLWDVLPRGGGLSTQAWWARHRAVLLTLWAHVPAISAFGVVVGAGALHSLAESGLVALLAAAATWARGRTLRTSAATLGMLSASAVGVHLSGGVIEMHFHFFVMVAVIALYQDWVAFLLAIAYVVVHHGVVGALAPTEVFDHPDALAHPWKWAMIHGVFIVAAGVVAMIAWRLNERASEDLREVQQHFQDAFDNAPIGMALVALDGRWIEVNRSLCEITGYSESDLLGKTFQDITHPDDLDRDLEQVRRLTGGDIPSYQLEKRYLRPDGSAVAILLSVTIVRNQGEPQYFIAQMEDISERKRAEAYYRRLYEGQRALVRELEEAHRLKSELFNIVSHEFKTPLASIIGFAGLLSKSSDRLTDGHRERYLETIARQAERLNRLVENLFVSARQIEPSSDALASVEEAMDAVQAQLSDTYDDVAFDVTIPSGLRPRISQEALRLVLLNLASNAVKHAAVDSRVTVVAYRTDGDVAVSVTNVGDAIPPDTRERIFEPFVQSEASGRTAEGVGLGLHIVDKLVTAHGGTVTLKEDDSSVTFTIRVPEGSVGAGPEIGEVSLTPEPRATV
jgi:PAS domain S-box-containing protein